MHVMDKFNLLKNICRSPKTYLVVVLKDLINSNLKLLAMGIKFKMYNMVSLN